MKNGKIFLLCVIGYIITIFLIYTEPLDYNPIKGYIFSFILFALLYFFLTGSYKPIVSAKPGVNLLDNPIEWANLVVGSGLKFFFAILIHIIAGIAIKFTDYQSAVPLFLFTTIFPIMYLYAMRKLLKELKKNQGNSRSFTT